MYKHEIGHSQVACKFKPQTCFDGLVTSSPNCTSALKYDLHVDSYTCFTMCSLVSLCLYVSLLPILYINNKSSYY